MENFPRTARKDRLALSVRALAALGQDEEPGSTGGETEEDWNR